MEWAMWSTTMLQTQKNALLICFHFDQLRTYAKLSQLGALPQAVLLYDKAARQRWGIFA
jgi:hypothetical protein